MRNTKYIAHKKPVARNNDSSLIIFNIIKDTK